MAQNFQEIPATQTIVSSRQPLLDRDAAAASNFSGTAFPTSNLLVGMRCHRTDLNKVYVLKDLTPTWIEVEDISSTSGIAPRATVLHTARNFSVTGDAATASSVSFDGSGNVALNVTLATLPGLTPGNYTKVTVNAKGLVTAAGSLTSTDLPSDISTNTLRMTATGLASLASTGHALQIGPDAGANLIADQNEIQSRNAGAAALLGLNVNGGNITIGNAASVTTIAGTLNVTSGLALPANSVLTADINASAVTTAKIADGAVTSGKLAAGATVADQANAAYGGVGSYLFAQCSANIANGADATVAGSTLNAAGLSSPSSTAAPSSISIHGIARAGTWRAMGQVVGAGGSAARSTTLFVRIA